MSNEIKQGDRVRVSKDAPRVYQKGSIFEYTEHQSTVHEVDGDAAIIGLDIEDSPIYSAPIAIPTKYLVKVDAEAKEVNVKIGDKVVVHYPSGDRIGRIQEIMLDGTYDIDFGGGCTGHNITRLQIEPYTKPTEQEEAEKPNTTIKIPVEVDLTDSYWDAYTANLAKEVALKVANKYTDPKEAAEYAVQTAEAVVAGLKRK